MPRVYHLIFELTQLLGPDVCNAVVQNSIPDLDTLFKTCQNFASTYEKLRTQYFNLPRNERLRLSSGILLQEIDVIYKTKIFCKFNISSLEPSIVLDIKVAKANADLTERIQKFTLNLESSREEIRNFRQIRNKLSYIQSQYQTVKEVKDKHFKLLKNCTLDLEPPYSSKLQISKSLTFKKIK